LWAPTDCACKNWPAQESVLLRVFILLRSLLLRVWTAQSELAIRQKLVSTELFLIVSPFHIASPDYFVHGKLVSTGKCTIAKYLIANSYFILIHIMLYIKKILFFCMISITWWQWNHGVEWWPHWHKHLAPFVSRCIRGHCKPCEC